MPVLDKANDLEVKKYNDFIRNSEFANVLQDKNWSLVKKEWFNEQIYIERDGKIVAAMSLLIRRFLKTYSMVYVPRGPVCSVYDTDLVTDLIKEAERVCKKYNAFMLRFDPEVEYDKNLEDIYNKLGYKVRNFKYDTKEFIQPIYNMILNIGDYDQDELMARFSSKTRYNIRLAGRRGVKISYHNSDEALNIFYDIYKTTVKRNDIGQRSLEYFKDMRDAYGEKLRIYIGEHEGDYLCGAITINYGKKVWYVYGASSNNKRNLMPNYIMQWEMIKWGLETGAQEYDFGGVFNLNNEDGLYRFKEGFCREDGVTTYIGEIDKVYKPIVYYGFTKLVPLAQNLIKKLSRN